EPETVTITRPVPASDMQIQWNRAAWQDAGDAIGKTLLQLVQTARPAGQAVELRLRGPPARPPVQPARPAGQAVERRLGAVAQRLPGLADRLRTLNSCELSLLPPGAAARGA